MKTATMLLPLLLLACASHAMPLESEVTSSSPNVLQSIPVEPGVEEVTVTDSHYRLVRERRSPWQQRPNRLQQPQPQPRPGPQPQPQQQSRGSITGGIHRERGVGTVVHAEGQGTVWRSRNGNAQLDAQGQYHRVLNGPARGSRNYNVGVTYTHRF